MNEVSIAELSTQDAPGVSQMIRVNLSMFDQAETTLASTFRRLKDFERAYEGEASVYFIAKLGDKLVGGGGVGPLHGLPPEEGIGEIRDLVVDPPERGKGIGAQLLRKLIDCARSKGYKRLYLETTAQMDKAQKLFQRFGFRAVKDFSGKDDSALPEDSVPCYFLLEEFGDSAQN